MDGSHKVQLTRDGKSLSCARWSPDGSEIWFVQGGQIWSAPISGAGTDKARLGKRTQRSDVPGGVGEFKLSPDGSQLLYTATVPSNVKSPKDFDPALDKAKAYVTEDLMYRHWDHWVEEIPHTYVATTGNGMITGEAVIDLLGGPDVKYELPLEPFGGLEQLAWSPNGRYIAYSCKKLTGKQYAFSTNTNIYVYCVLTGETTELPGRGGYDTDPVWSPDGNAIAWLSMRRDGYEADKVDILCTKLGFIEDCEGQSGNPQPEGPVLLTENFPYNAGGLFWAADSGSLYFSALNSDGVESLYRIATADGSLERLTGGELWYDFSGIFGVLDDGTLLASYCSMDFPAELVAVKDGQPVQLTHENEAILSQIKPHKTEKRFVTTVDGKQMLTWVLFPPEFDESKTYPAIEIFLGGPQGTLSQGWSYRWNYCLMCNQG